MALTIKRIEKATTPGRYGDGAGLYLQVTPEGGRSWILRYERDDLRPGHIGKRRERWMGLGPLNDFTLEEARERARKARQLLKDGIDPLEARKEERTAQVVAAAQVAAKAKTFEQCAQLYYDTHSPGWKNAKHRSQFSSTMSTYVYPKIGKLPVAEVNRDLVLKVVQQPLVDKKKKPIGEFWKVKNATAGRVLRRMKGVLDFAKVNGWRDGENPAAWDGTSQQAKKGHSFEECQARARATGNKWMGTDGRHFSNPTSPTAKGFMAQCMRGEV